MAPHPVSRQPPTTTSQRTPLPEDVALPPPAFLLSYVHDRDLMVITDTSALPLNAEDFHCFRSDPLVRWRGIADVLEGCPEAWDWALANIERWLAQGRLHPAPLMEWRQRLLEGRNGRVQREALLEALRIPPLDAHQDQLRSCSPFVGGPFLEASVPALLV